MKITRLSDCPFIPWKNNGGVTQELFKTEEDPFRLRISVAKVSSSGPFSFFPDYNRELVLLKGSLSLNISGTKIDLNPFDKFSFSGDQVIQASLISSEVQDFNVISLKGLKIQLDILDMNNQFLEIHKNEFLFLAEGKAEFESQVYTESLFQGPGTLFFSADVKVLYLKM